MADNEDMSTSHLLILDDGLGAWGPLTDLRPVFDLRTGAHTTRGRIEHIIGRRAEVLNVPAPLAALAQEEPGVTINGPLTPGDWLVVNGRWLGAAGREAVQGLKPGQAVVQEDGQLVALRLGITSAAQGLKLAVPDRASEVVRLAGRVLAERPWHILDNLEETLGYDLTHGLPAITDPLPAGVAQFGSHRFILVNARLQPGVVLNCEAGPIRIEADVIVGAGSVLEGPCHIGAGTQLAAHTYIRPHTVIGPRCKVAGEISFSILQGSSNKAHYGYLGHSLVGQWVNLGAGTTVSNLKNTYGKVRVQLGPGEEPQDTGRVFQGPIVGDYVRTAIGSRLLTGSCLATGTMLALSGYAPKGSRPFGFYTDQTPDGAGHDPDKFLAVAKAMMARRHVAMSAALEARLRDLMR